MYKFGNLVLGFFIPIFIFWVEGVGKQISGLVSGSNPEAPSTITMGTTSLVISLLIAYGLSRKMPLKISLGMMSLGILTTGLLWVGLLAFSF